MSAMEAMVGVLGEVLQERHDQHAKWGVQNHPNGTGGPERIHEAEWARDYCNAAAARGTVTWLDIFEEEAAEVMAESNPERLRAELVQVAAVAVAWVEAIDRRRGVS